MKNYFLFTMGKKQIGFYRTWFILMVGFLIMGAYFYDENQDLMLQKHLYYRTPISWTYRRGFTVNLTEGYEYTIYMHVRSRPDHPLYARYNFTETPERDFEYNLFSGAEDSLWRMPKENQIFFDPFYQDVNETLRIWGSSNFEVLQGAEQEIRIYQNLPRYLIYKPLWVILFCAVLMVLWVITFNYYERIFDDIENYQEKYNLKAEVQ